MVASPVTTNFNTMTLYRGCFRHPVLLRRHGKARIFHLDEQDRVEEHPHDISQHPILDYEEKISLNVSRLLLNPARMAGVLTSRPDFNAR